MFSHLQAIFRSSLFPGYGPEQAERWKGIHIAGPKVFGPRLCFCFCYWIQFLRIFL